MIHVTVSLKSMPAGSTEADSAVWAAFLQRRLDGVGQPVTVDLDNRLDRDIFTIEGDDSELDPDYLHDQISHVRSLVDFIRAIYSAKALV